MQAATRLQQWQNLSDTERQAIRDRFVQFMRLPAAERKKIRKQFQRFRSLPAEKRQALKARWQNLSAQQRQQVLQRLRQQKQLTGE